MVKLRLIVQTPRLPSEPLRFFAPSVILSSDERLFYSEAKILECDEQMKRQQVTIRGVANAAPFYLLSEFFRMHTLTFENFMPEGFLSRLVVSLCLANQQRLNVPTFEFYTLGNEETEARETTEGCGSEKGENSRKMDYDSFLKLFAEDAEAPVCFCKEKNSLPIMLCGQCAQDPPPTFCRNCIVEHSKKFGTKWHASFSLMCPGCGDHRDLVACGCDKCNKGQDFLACQACQDAKHDRRGMPRFELVNFDLSQILPPGTFQGSVSNGTKRTNEAVVGEMSETPCTIEIKGVKMAFVVVGGHLCILRVGSSPNEIQVLVSYLTPSAAEDTSELFGSLQKAMAEVNDNFYRSTLRFAFSFDAPSKVGGGAGFISTSEEKADVPQELTSIAALRGGAGGEGGGAADMGGRGESIVGGSSAHCEDEGDTTSFESGSQFEETGQERENKENAVKAFSVWIASLFDPARLSDEKNITIAAAYFVRDEDYRAPNYLIQDMLCDPPQITIEEIERFPFVSKAIKRRLKAFIIAEKEEIKKRPRKAAAVVTGPGDSASTTGESEASTSTIVEAFATSFAAMGGGGKADSRDAEQNKLSLHAFGAGQISLRNLRDIPLWNKEACKSLLCKMIDSPQILAELYEIVRVWESCDLCIPKYPFIDASYEFFQTEIRKHAWRNKKVVLLVGHGNKDGFLFAAGGQTPLKLVSSILSNAEMADFLNTLKVGIELLFLNFCYSHNLAEYLDRKKKENKIPFIIGWEGSVTDAVSVAFSLRFFTSLAQSVHCIEAQSGDCVEAYANARLFCLSNGLTGGPGAATPFLLSSNASKISRGWKDGLDGFTPDDTDSEAEPPLAHDAQMFGVGGAGFGVSFHDVEKEEKVSSDYDESKEYDGMTYQDLLNSARREMTPITEAQDTKNNLLAGGCEKQALRALGFAIVQQGVEIVRGGNKKAKDYDANAWPNVVDFWKTNPPTMALLEGFGGEWKPKEEYYDLFGRLNSTIGQKDSQLGAIYHVAERLATPAYGDQGRLQVEACIEWLKCAYDYRIRDLVRCSVDVCTKESLCPSYNVASGKCDKHGACTRHIHHLQTAESFRELIVALQNLLLPAGLQAAVGGQSPHLLLPEISQDGNKCQEIIIDDGHGECRVLVPYAPSPSRPPEFFCQAVIPFSDPIFKEGPHFQGTGNGDMGSYIRLARLAQAEAEAEVKTNKKTAVKAADV